MSSKEEHCLAFCKVPKSIPKDGIEYFLKQRSLRGAILDWEEIPGIEADRELTRWVCLLQSTEDVQRLIELKAVELFFEDASYNVMCQKPTACEIPERWKSFEIPPMQPEVPVRGFPGPHPNVPVDAYGMASGFYENIPNNPPQQFGYNPSSQQTEHMPGQSSGQSSDQNMPGMPGQQGYPPGAPGYVRPPGFPQPMYGYPPNFDHRQQQKFPQGPPNFLQYQPNFIRDPSTGMLYIAPQQPYPVNPNQTNTDQNIPGQFAGHPPAYSDLQPPDIDPLNVTQPFILPSDPIVSSQAIHDQKLKEESIADNRQQHEDSTHEEGNFA
ncbi:hypothetical protein ACF0H5_008841 [Mactra antiquata]